MFSGKKGTGVTGLLFNGVNVKGEAQEVFVEVRYNVVVKVQVPFWNNKLGRWDLGNI